jgi:hypothetical protein
MAHIKWDLYMNSKRESWVLVPRKLKKSDREAFLLYTPLYHNKGTLQSNLTTAEEIKEAKCHLKIFHKSTCIGGIIYKSKLQFPKE